MQSPAPARRRFTGPIFALVASAVIIAHRVLVGTSAPAVMCETDLAPAKADAVMLGASWCRYCGDARRLFTEKHVSYCEYDVEESQRGAELYQKSRLQGLPIIYIGQSMFVGFDRDALMQAIQALPKPPLGT
ncbi:MAG: hypothetical protein HY749_09565 [Gammaproteobacteria bacterium]|nr:hypothetical protein [Gammaproteobacteria bacterium]MBI5616549.1 hypothetical protein [Gammaproteobacteria bacterium]